MASVTFKGSPVSLKGDLPQVNDKAPDFTYVKQDLSEATLYASGDKIKVIIAVPSLDTGVCAMEAKSFNQKLGNKANVEGIVISKDLPFAMKRFCEAENVANVTSGSDFRYGEFSDKYNTLQADGPLKGLSARAVFVVDKDNTIKYTELVPEITTEPDYDKVLAAVDQLA